MASPSISFRCYTLEKDLVDNIPSKLVLEHFLEKVGNLINMVLSYNINKVLYLSLSEKKTLHVIGKFQSNSVDIV
jgi:hypothetical protein